MNFHRLPALFRLLLRAVLGFGATAAAVLGYSALLSLAVQAGQLRGRVDGASLGQYDLELRPERGAPVGGVQAAAHTPAR